MWSCHQRIGCHTFSSRSRQELLRTGSLLKGALKRLLLQPLQPLYVSSMYGQMQLGSQDPGSRGQTMICKILTNSALTPAWVGVMIIHKPKHPL